MRWVIVLLCCIGIVGCGFRPLYWAEDNTDVIQESERIRIAPIADAAGYQMDMIFRHKLNPRQVDVAKTWELRVQLAEPVFYDQSIRGDNFASLEKMTLTASYQLVNLTTQEQVISSSVSAGGSYNIINEPYATTMAKEKMYQNLVQILADDIVLHLFSYLRGTVS